MNYWLMKSEPSTFGIDDLAAMPQQTEHWDGVRNYQARNMMRDQMRVGDQILFYHSNCKPPGIVGIAEVVREAYPDHTAFDPEAHYHDPKSDPENPRWFMVDVKLVRTFAEIIPLDLLRAQPQLESMALVRKGNRLSIMPVSADEWAHVLEMAGG